MKILTADLLPGQSGTGKGITHEAPQILRKLIPPPVPHRRHRLRPRSGRRHPGRVVSAPLGAGAPSRRGVRGVGADAEAAVTPAESLLGVIALAAEHLRNGNWSYAVTTLSVALDM